MPRRGTHRAVVALAHKNARMAWVLLMSDGSNNRLNEKLRQTA